MALSVILAGSSSLVLFVSGLFTLFAPLPFSLLYGRRGAKATIVSILGALALLSLLYRLPAEWLRFLPGVAFYPGLGLGQVRSLALLAFFGYAWMGLSLSWVGRRKFGWEKGMVLVVVSGFVVTALGLFAVTRFSGGDFIAAFRESLRLMIQRLVEMNPDFPAADREVLATSVLQTTWNLLPSLWLGLTLATAALNLLFARRWLPGLLCAQWGEFARWRIYEGLIWVPLAAGISYFLSHYWWKQGWLSWVALNVILVACTVYFFQGMAIFSFYIQRLVSPLLRLMLGFIFVLFFQILAILMIGVGLFDFWFDFRKIKKIGGRA